MKINSFSTVAFAALAALTLPCAHGAVTNVTASVALDADADWTGRGRVALAHGAGIDLAGHSLKIDGFADLASQLVDETVPGGTVSSSEIFSGSAAFLFDNDFRYTVDSSNPKDLTRNHRVCASVRPLVVDYDFGEGQARVLRSYKIHFQNIFAHNTSRAPRNWTFQGSADGANWVVLDTRTVETNGWANGQARFFSFWNETAYRHYRLRVTEACADNVIEFYQLEYFTTPVAPYDLTAPGAEHVVSNSTIYSGSAVCLFDNRFVHTYDTSAPSDTNKNHRVCVNKLPFFVTYDFGASKVVNGYRIWYNSLGTGPGYERAPKGWTFECSDDNKTWTILDTRRDYTNWVRSANCVRAFDFPNATPHRYYRLNVSSAGSGSTLEFFQLEFLGAPQVASTASAYGDDLTSPGGADATRSTTPAGGHLADVFDNDFRYVYDSKDTAKNHRILTPSNKDFDLVYDFGEGKSAVAEAYRIYFNSVTKDQTRHPVKWDFYGSADGMDWTLLDARNDTSDWTLGGSRTFDFANTTAYRFYKLHFYAVRQYIEFYQVEFLQRLSTCSLEVAVPEGETATNDTVMIRQGVRLEKSGAGTYVAAQGGCDYSCGTVVNAGTLKAALDGAAIPLGTAGAQAVNSAVRVDAGATLDMGGHGNWGELPLILNGGTLLAEMPATAAPTDTWRYVALTADSRMQFAGALTMAGEGTFDLGGKTLTVACDPSDVWTNLLTFAGGGSVAFELPRKALGGKERKILAWETPPASGTTFVRGAAGHYAVSARADGVYVLPYGAAVIVR